jgi:hypothetical protein
MQSRLTFATLTATLIAQAAQAAPPRVVISPKIGGAVVTNPPTLNPCNPNCPAAIGEVHATGILPPYAGFGGMIFQIIVDGGDFSLSGDSVSVGACDSHAAPSGGTLGRVVPFDSIPASSAGCIYPFLETQTRVRVSNVNNPGGLTVNPAFGINTYQYSPTIPLPGGQVPFNPSRDVTLFRFQYNIVPRSYTRVVTFDIPPEGISGQAMGLWTPDGNFVLSPVTRDEVDSATMYIPPASVVSNGGFETPSISPSTSRSLGASDASVITGWTFSSDRSGNQSTLNRLIALSGAQSLSLQDGDSIRQSVSTLNNPGRWRLRFSAIPADESHPLSLTFGTRSTTVRRSDGTAIPGNSAWMNFTFVFNAMTPSASTPLMFQNPAVSGFGPAWQIDEVAIDPVWMITDPQPVELCQGSGAVLTVAAGGGALNYQWMRDTKTLTDGVTGSGTIISGARTAALFINNASPGDIGNYFCMVWNAGGVVRSGNARLSVSPICIADFNCDGGVEFGDVAAFFSAWQSGNSNADINQDGGIDGDDVSSFFAAWEQSSCT